jgi:hypothetical protein
MVFKVLCLTKTLRVVKLVTIILLAACLQVSATGYSQITLAEKDAPLAVVCHGKVICLKEFLEMCQATLQMSVCRCFIVLDELLVIIEEVILVLVLWYIPGINRLSFDHQLRPFHFEYRFRLLVVRFLNLVRRLGISENAGCHSLPTFASPFKGIKDLFSVLGRT